LAARKAAALGHRERARPLPEPFAVPSVPAP